uniref:WGR domain-containing protein n=1 Tax=Corethron hystrix TaxID=216773 RepID=A0A7S1BBI6_9STRA|mmetsp:Transcript_20737/g.47073  ORF Transcript_20737/g.47073 Transcript_20737/m.47073 type:complete len:158 (+) Transcript_20737:60-533(+)
MFYLEYQSTRFWSCEKKWSRKVKIHFGKCGFGGTTIKKDFETAEDAQDYMDKQVSAKRIQGYVDVNIPETKNTTNSSASTQKSALTARSNSSRSLRTVTPTKEKVGLKRHAPPNLNNEEEIKVDSGLAKIDSALFFESLCPPKPSCKAGRRRQEKKY